MSDQASLDFGPEPQDKPAPRRSTDLLAVPPREAPAAPYMERQPAAWKPGRARVLSPGRRGPVPVEVPAWLYGDFAVHKPLTGTPAGAQWRGGAVSEEKLVEAAAGLPEDAPLAVAARQAGGHMARGRTFRSSLAEYASAAAARGADDLAPWHALAQACGGRLAVALDDVRPAKAGWAVSHGPTGLPALEESFRRRGDCMAAVERVDPAFETLDATSDATELARHPAFARAAGQLRAARDHARGRDLLVRRLGRAERAIRRARPRHEDLSEELAAHERASAAFSLGLPPLADLDAAPAPPPAATVSSSTARYAVAVDHVIANAGDLASGSAADHATANILAIEVLGRLEREEREAGPEEREILARFVGWGGMPGVFSDHAGANIPRETKDALRDILDEERYAAVRRATTNAHYTDQRIGTLMWQALGRLGVDGGRLLEPGCGAGWILGAAPEEMRENIRATGIEADPVAAGVARQLYPSADIRTARLEDTPLPDNFYDVAVGNVPFSAVRPADARYRALRPVTHDYFILRTVDALKPGGAALLLTSTGTLDKEDGRVREALRDKAELVEAVRLPAGSFRGAKSEVVSDLLVLRKRAQPLSELPEAERAAVLKGEPDWIPLAGLPDPAGGDAIPVNAFLAADPGRILGALTRTTDGYGNPAVSVRLKGGVPAIATALEARLSRLRRLPGLPPPPQADTLAAGADTLVEAPGEVKEGAFFVMDAGDGDAGDAGDARADAGAVMVKRGGAALPSELSGRDAAMVADALGVRDALRAVFRAQQQDSPEAARAAARDVLSARYDAFAEAHGAFGSRRNVRLLRRDPDGPLLLALEEPGEDGPVKSPAFDRDTVRPLARAERADDAAAALARVLDEKGSVDIARMGELLDLPGPAAASAARGLIYPTPGGGWATAGEYLSGDVVTKLGEAEAAAGLDQNFQANVEALARVQPEQVAYSEIAVRLGSPIAAAGDYAGFIAKTLECSANDISVALDERTGHWTVEAASAYGRTLRRTPIARRQYGTARLDALRIVEKAMNGSSIRLTNKDGFDVGATMAARGKADLWKREFREWVWKDPERRARIARYYNARFNRTVPRHYDGSHLTFPGMSREWAAMIRPPQADAVWRGLSGGNLALAHEVGTGKTLVLAALAQEAKRVGKAHKTMIAVQGATLAEFAAKYRAAYPAAKLLVWPEKKSVTAAERREFMSRAATGDWDSIIVTHDAFDLLPASPETEARLLAQQRDEARAVLMAADAPAGRGDTRHIKWLETAVDGLEAKLRKLMETGRQDNTVYWEDLGVDQLLVDEAQRYKNLYTYTSLGHVKGLPSAASQRAAGFYAKCCELNQRTGERGLALATGTPVSNSLAELFTLQRYLQAEALAARGIAAFDSWAGVFAEPEDRIEIDVTGNFKQTTRLSSFLNLPELKQMTDGAIDIVFADEVADLERPDAMPSPVAVPASAAQRAYIAELGARAKALGSVDPREDNMLKISTEGRLAALDMRLVDPAAADAPGSKVNDFVKRAARIYKDNPGKTQLLFFDIGVNPTQLNPDFSLREDLKRKLTEAGIPPEEIGDFFDASGPDRDALKRRVRNGEVRIAMGSTEKLGTGVNVQDRVVALHHLDAPWTPAALAQRNGRGHRQGNENSRVHIYPYVTQNTFDAFSWQLLDVKSRFISQFMRSDGIGRIMRDPDSEVLTPAQVMAIATGDPLALYRAELESDIGALELQRATHSRDQIDMARVDARLEGEIEGIVAALPDAGIRSEQATLARGREGVLELAGGGEVTGRDALTARFEAALERRREALAAALHMPASPPVAVGTWRGVLLEAGGTRFPGPSLELVFEDGARRPFAGGPQAADAQLRLAESEPARLTAARAERHDERAKLAGLMGAPFHAAAELDLKKSEFERLEKIMRLPAPDKKAVDALDQKHPKLAYGAIVERVDALLDATGEDSGAGREAAAWHALAARRHEAFTVRAEKVPMPITRADGSLDVRLGGVPKGAGTRYSLPPAPPDPAPPINDGDPDLRRDPLAADVDHVWPDNEKFRERSEAVGAWAQAWLDNVAPFVIPVVGGEFVDSLNPAPFAEGAAHEFDDQVKGSDAYHTVDLADDEFTVQWLVLLNATSKELERDLAHETLHALHDSNKITRKEWEAVTHPALIDAWAAQYEIATRYSESPAGHQRQEAVAERFGEAVARGSQRSQKEGSAVAPVRQGPGGRGGLGEWIALGDLPGEDKVDPAVLQAAQDVFRLAANGRIGRRRTHPAAETYARMAITKRREEIAHALGHNPGTRFSIAPAASTRRILRDPAAGEAPLPQSPELTARLAANRVRLAFAQGDAAAGSEAMGRAAVSPGARYGRPPKEDAEPDPASFALAAPRLHFEREAFAPAMEVMDEGQILAAARERYECYHTGDEAIAEAAMRYFGPQLSDDEVRRSPEYTAELREWTNAAAPGDSAEDTAAAALATARRTISFEQALERVDRDGGYEDGFRWDLETLADDIMVEEFLREPGLSAVRDSHGHGYTILTEDNDGYVALDPSGMPMYGDGTWEGVVALARDDAARYGTSPPLNRAAPLADWTRRPVRGRLDNGGFKAGAALARGDFAVYREETDGRFSLLHLATGASLMDGRGEALEEDSPARLRDLAEALQPRFAWRSIASPKDLAAMLGEDGPARTAHLRLAIADFAGGGEGWREGGDGNLTLAPAGGSRRQASFALGGTAPLLRSATMPQLRFEQADLGEGGDAMNARQIRTFAGYWGDLWSSGNSPEHEDAAEKFFVTVLGDDEVRRSPEYAEILQEWRDSDVAGPMPDGMVAERALAETRRRLALEKAAAALDDPGGRDYQGFIEYRERQLADEFLADPGFAAVRDAAGHGYVILTFGDDRYRAIDPDGEPVTMPDWGSWDEAVNAAREDADMYGALRPRNRPAPLAGWSSRPVNVENAGRRMARVRGDFGVAALGADRFGLVHLGSGGLIGSHFHATPPLVAFGAASDGNLMALAEALQPRFAWRSISSSGELAAVLGNTPARGPAARGAAVRAAIADFAAGGDWWREDPAGGERLTLEPTAPGGQASFALAPPLFEREKFAPFAEVANEAQRLRVAHDRYDAQAGVPDAAFEDAAAQVIPEEARKIHPDTVREGAAWGQVRAYLGAEADEEQVRRVAAEWIAAEDLASGGNTYTQAVDRAGRLALEHFAAHYPQAEAIAEARGHGYVIATWDGHRSYQALHENGQVCDSGSWDEATRAARVDAAFLARINRYNGAAGDTWTARDVRVVATGETGQPVLAALPGEVRGDFAVTAPAPGQPSLLVHLRSGAPLTDVRGAPLAEDSPARLRGLAEALQPRFAWRSVGSPGQLRALLGNAGPARTAPLREAIADFASGGEGWREDPAGAGTFTLATPPPPSGQASFALAPQGRRLHFERDALEPLAGVLETDIRLRVAHEWYGEEAAFHDAESMVVDQRASQLTPGEVREHSEYELALEDLGGGADEDDDMIVRAAAEWIIASEIYEYGDAFTETMERADEIALGHLAEGAPQAAAVNDSYGRGYAIVTLDGDAYFALDPDGGEVGGGDWNDAVEAANADISRWQRPQRAQPSRAARGLVGPACPRARAHGELGRAPAGPGARRLRRPAPRAEELRAAAPRQRRAGAGRQRRAARSGHGSTAARVRRGAAAALRLAHDRRARRIARPARRRRRPGSRGRHAAARRHRRLRRRRRTLARGLRPRTFNVAPPGIVPRAGEFRPRGIRRRRQLCRHPAVAAVPAGQFLSACRRAAVLPVCEFRAPSPG